MTDLAGTSVSTVSYFGAGLTGLMPGQLAADGRSPGKAAVAAPRFDVVPGAFEDALAAARALSGQAPLTSGAVHGYQPVGIVQAADGTRAITPLLTPEGSWLVMSRDQETFMHRYSRNVAGLVAVVTPERYLDLRTIEVGGRL